MTRMAVILLALVAVLLALSGAPPASAAGLLAEYPEVERIVAAPDPCHDLNWWAERGLVTRDEVELTLARLDCRPAQYARTAVELAQGRAGCEDISWAARAEAITYDQYLALLERYPQCRPAKSLLVQAYDAAAVGDYHTVASLAAQAHGVPVSRFLAVVDCESRFNPGARNPSGASGLLQILAVYWPARAANAGFPGASPYDPVANAWTGAWLWATSGSGHWAQCL